LLACRLVEELVAVAAQQGCYKVILDCSEDNQAFYEKCGLTRKEVQMVKYLDR
jgi:glucosamine-phosphate N-acetyltransferase